VIDAMRGRMLALYSLVVVGLSQAIGALAAGAVARVFAIDWAIGVAAVVMLGYGISVFRANPGMRRL
jgi:hypothetical protein